MIFGGGKNPTRWLSQSWWFRRKVWCCQMPFQGAGDMGSKKQVKAPPSKKTFSVVMVPDELQSQPGCQPP